MRHRLTLVALLLAGCGGEPHTRTPDATTPMASEARFALTGGGRMRGGSLTADVVIGAVSAQRTTSGGAFTATPGTPVAP